MENTVIVKTKSEDETKGAGRALGKTLGPGGVVALFGDLGSGKTAFVKGIAQALGVKEEVTSPTFAVLNEYSCENGALLRHFDMYRISSPEDLLDVGYYESLEPPYITVVEWSENISEFIPKSAVAVRFFSTGGDLREIAITIPDNF